MIFLAHPQKQEVGRGEPRGARPVSSGETSVRFGIDAPLPRAPRLIGSASDLSNEAPGLFTAGWAGNAAKNVKL